MPAMDSLAVECAVVVGVLRTGLTVKVVVVALTKTLAETLPIVALVEVLPSLNVDVQMPRSDRCLNF